MKLRKFFAFVPLFFFTVLNVKCIKNTTPKIHMNVKYGIHLQNGKYKHNKYRFIGYSKKEYNLLILNKNQAIHKKYIKKHTNSNVLYLQDNENGRREFKYNSLHKNEDKNLWNKFTSKMVILNKNMLAKFVCAGAFCLFFYPVYTYLMNKKIDFVIANVFKEKLLCLDIPKKFKRYFLFMSLAEFKASPFFLSAILIASYSLYIILKVYIEKYKEANRIKSSIDAYNKSKDEYINTGRDSTEENRGDSTGENGRNSTNKNDNPYYFDDIDENNDFNEDLY
ncbi:conserved Plasmodium protein, unknown function [Plasmodium ovale]|uniref:Fam-m protein n=2 Tax=Plasmodium ovale TaxID=36330 RepID=A0A1D3TI04_PLAOA|nr:conserved Plasmodium protein, unknown function [Plasmodium ovale]